MEKRYLHKNGQAVWVLLSTLLVRNLEGRPVYFISQAVDITDKILAMEQLKHLSFHDGLTGLYNRVYFEHELKRIEQSRTQRVGVIVGDIDGLKLINDSRGHRQGDELIRVAADILRSCFRPSDMVARIGGDEFVVIVVDCTAEDIKKICARLKDAIANYNQTSPAIPLNMSIGFAINQKSKIVMEELFKEADNKMYQEKLKRKSTRANLLRQILKNNEQNPETP